MFSIDDDDAKVRRNLVAASVIAIAATFLGIPLEVIISKLISLEKDPLSSRTIWAFFIVVLLYLWTRHRFSKLAKDHPFKWSAHVKKELDEWANERLRREVERHRQGLKPRFMQITRIDFDRDMKPTEPAWDRTEICEGQNVSGQFSWKNGRGKAIFAVNDFAKEDFRESRTVSTPARLGVFFHPYALARALVRTTFYSELGVLIALPQALTALASACAMINLLNGGSPFR